MPAGHGPAQVAQHGVGVVLVRRGHAERRLELRVAVGFRNVVARGGVRRREHEGRQVESCQGELDRRVDLARAGAGLRAGGEAFEVDDEKLRRARDSDAFRRFALLAAVWAAPDLIAGKDFGGAVGAKAVTDVNEAAVGCGRDLNADRPKRFVSC